MLKLRREIDLMVLEWCPKGIHDDSGTCSSAAQQREIPKENQMHFQNAAQHICIHLSPFFSR